MTTLTQWLSKYSTFTHAISVLFLFLIAAYAAVPEFHSLVSQIYAALPAWLGELAVTILALIAWYRNGQKPAA